MGTRAVFTFRDDVSEHHVYKHWDGYPEGAAQWLVQGLAYAWKLPRYEADEMACAFIAGNKKIHTGGDLRLLPSGSITDVAPGDIAYWYEVWQAPNGQLIVKAWSVADAVELTFNEVFYGRLADFCKKESSEAYELYRMMYPAKFKAVA